MCLGNLQDFTHYTCEGRGAAILKELRRFLNQPKIYLSFLEMTWFDLM